MELPLVVGVDGSECSLRAVDWATDEAARAGLALRLVHASLWQRYEHTRPARRTRRLAVRDTAGSGAARRRTARGVAVARPWEPLVPPPAEWPGENGTRETRERWETQETAEREPGDAGTGEPEEAAGVEESPERIVGAAAERVARRNPDVKVLTDVACEETEAALLREARNASALITGERGRGAVPGVLLGTVSLAVATKAPCPVIVVRGSPANRAGANRRVLLAAAEAASCADAVRFAFREAALTHSELEALRAWRCPAYQMAGRLRWPKERARRHQQRAARLLDEVLREAEREHPGTEVVRTVVEGPAHEMLLARSQSADLLVAGAQRQPGRVDARIGRVAHTMLHYADCPVAVVPHRE
ncbi:hypothetical protein GCM10018793_10100 [Streptomyces sulfonofaciens]|uniref:UspA domain-containing protein n=1 Tax=Streptomyces sulfonofaciens TaxID=68272 RepID=A0A919FU71_9ACTN|nr:universal stress protein [Streptomyces sulfonofaciens]GHH72682.1 hypothetical protein GCM10018793_10100 [Streptomyces sulfonofaciens]